MASSIARHTSTVSLISTTSLPRENGVLVQALSRYRDQLEVACDKILEKCCTNSKSGSGDLETATTQMPRVLDDRARKVLTQCLIELLSSLILPEPMPQSIKDVNVRLAEGQLCFPEKLMPTNTELEEFRNLVEKGKKSFSASLDLPVDKIFTALKEFAGRFNHPTCIYITAVTEKVISNFVKMVIYFEERAQSEHVISAVTIQNIFQFYRDRVKSQRKQLDVMFMNTFPLDYNKCVDELVWFLSSSLEQMNLILRVFREPIVHSPACSSLNVGSEEAVVREVFRETLDLYNNFRLLLDYLESDCADDLPFSSSTFSGPLSTSQNRSFDESPPLTTAENRRLVGRLLIEPAEDIALASYLDSPDPLSNIWRLSERSDVLKSLATSSRAIVHTVFRLKMTSSDAIDSRLSCLHSLCCSSCRKWDQKECLTSTTKEKVLPSFNCNAVVNCFRYLLPRLLLLPVFQFFHFYRLVNALLQQAYDCEDRKLLFLVVDYLLSARLNIKSVLTRYPDLHVQLARLVATGHLTTSQISATSSFCGHHISGSTAINAHHRSYSASPSSLTPPIRRDSSAHHQHHHNRCNTPPLSLQPQQPPIVTLSAVFCAGGGGGSGHLANPFIFGTPTTTAPGSTATTMMVSEEEVEENVDSMMSALMSGGVCNTVTRTKLEELERFTGGKDRLLTAAITSSTMGTFVMEGRLWVKDEGKRVASERQAYLFTNCLLLCKRTERRTTLAPAMVGAAGLQPLLRVKRRLSLETVHVIDCATPLRLHLEAFSDSHPLAECTSLLSTATSLSRYPVSELNHRLHATAEESEQCSFSLEFCDMDPRQLCSAFESVGGSEGCSANAGANSGSLDVPQSVQFHYLYFEAPSFEEKADWMASLLSITTSRIYERHLRTLPKLEIPLRLPSPEKYRFAQPDTPEVIVFEPLVGNQFSSATTAAHRLLQSSLSSRIRSASTTASVDDPLDSFDELEDEVEIVDMELFPATPTDEDPLGGTEKDLAPPLSVSTSSHVHSPHLGPQTLTAPGTPIPSFHHSAFHRSQIQYATIEKLIERLTYPAYFDDAAVNAFLISYRRFISPMQLLDLLIERFNVPYPDFTLEECQMESVVGPMKRRFRSGYKRWVQARVMAFLFRWTSSPRYFAYDFAPHVDLRIRLAAFLAGVRVRILLPVVQAIEYVLTKGSSTTVPATSTSPYVSASSLRLMNTHNSTSASLSADSLSRIDLLQIHPLELAEQVTLCEFDLYLRIEFWEVDGRERSLQDSPNLSACKHFSNKFRDWLVYSILSERNFEDRVVAIQRVIDLMLIFEHHRNLQGCQESKAVLLSAAVFRLKKAFEAAIRARPYRKKVQQLQKEGQGLARRTGKSSRGLESGDTPVVIEKASMSAAAIASPCLPYIAMRVSTQLIHLELHQPDRIVPSAASPDDASAGNDTCGLINFAKQRRLAAIIEHFLQHQLVPYAFPPQPRIQQALLASLDAVSLEDGDFESRMYALSECYEPREPLPEHLQPAPEVERRLNKEAIQAANYLAGLSLKEKLQHEQVSTYKAYLAPRQIKTSGRVSSPRLSSPPTPSTLAPSTLPPPPSPLLPPPPPPPPLAPTEQRVAALWTTRLRQHRAGQQALLPLAQGITKTSPRPLSSPTAVSSTGVIHHHSVSDSQMENLSNGRLPACHSSALGGELHSISIPPVPPLTSPLSSPPPPPPPPRRQSSGAPSSSSPVSLSHSPSPLFPLATAQAANDGGLPPLPPKPGQRTPSAMVGLSPSAPSRQFFDAVHPDCLSSTPPLPPRRHFS